MDGAEQVHHGSGAGAPHAEVKDGDAVSGGIGHGPIAPAHFDAVPFREEVYVLGEVDQQNILRKIFRGRAGIAGQPIGNNIGLSFHCWLTHNLSRARSDSSFWSRTIHGCVEGTKASELWCCPLTSGFRPLPL